MLALIAKLEDPAADLVRKDGFFKGLDLDAADYTSPEAVADLLVEHPRLMQRPVLVRGERAIIGRPKDRVAPFLAG
ncbi:arsenate reductase family protein [Aeromicrobium sp. UC242_57]|uniref:arsenate reductase family protein n=1 Tax=Aeromicrobium sp. UC242_57 TaxID=3374624 RepID=UPI00378CA880